MNRFKFETFTAIFTFLFPTQNVSGGWCIYGLRYTYTNIVLCQYGSPS